MLDPYVTGGNLCLVVPPTSQRAVNWGARQFNEVLCSAEGLQRVDVSRGALFNVYNQIIMHTLWNVPRLTIICPMCQKCD